MSMRVGLSLYYSLFGVAGIILAARARLLGRPVQVAVEVPGIPHPVYLRMRTTDVASCAEILIKRQYDWDFGSAPRTIIDAGANIGLASIFYANKYPDARIIAIEPEASNYQMLVQNTAAYRNVTTVNAALWNENCDLEIFDPQQGHTAFQTRDKRDLPGAQRTRVPGITLDKLLGDFGINHVDLLKIDIEGAEREVFAGSGSWIQCVDIIAIELHDWMLPGCEQIVQRAAKDFELQWKNGETTYLARKLSGSQIAVGARPAPRSAGSNVHLKMRTVA
jgi:FkbM family methyltransferase